MPRIWFSLVATVAADVDLAAGLAAEPVADLVATALAVEPA
jgi:hypothetical protein